MSTILVAGIGNIFMGDDAFGSEVARKLLGRDLPESVTVVDFGIRGMDLTYALLDGYHATILIDAAQRGETPGAVTLVRPDPKALEATKDAGIFIEPHNLDPAKVLRVVSAHGGKCDNIVLVACEPETLGDEHDGAMGLSPVVAEAVDVAVERVVELVREFAETGAWQHAQQAEMVS